MLPVSLRHRISLLAQSEIEIALLKATFERIDLERELAMACERPAGKPGLFDEGYDEWRSSPEYARLSQIEQEVRLRVYAADERWQTAADAYYESCFDGTERLGSGNG